jgi:glycosyltransferase involved in cell wall biosynthesis
LVLAGDCPDEAYGDELRALAGGDERITFAGHVQGRRLAELFSNARIYVQPSELEGLSIALLEAMSYGNCCLVSDIPPNIEALGDTGWYFKSRDVASLRDQLGHLLRLGDQTGRLGQMAKARVGEHFGWEGIVSKFENLYGGLLRSKAA